MITVYTHNTPNGHKVTIALEELGLPYEVQRVNILAGEQFAPEITALNPNAKIPVIVDHDAGVTVYESNAILWYLAEKTGRLLPSGAKARSEAIELLFLQASGVGPMFGQRAFYTLFTPEAVPAAQARYTTEAERLERVIETLLTGRDYFCGDYSIVDIAFWGWINTSMKAGFGGESLRSTEAWYDRVAVRPAVQRGAAIPEPLIDFAPLRQRAQELGILAKA